MIYDRHKRTATVGAGDTKSHDKAYIIDGKRVHPDAIERIVEWFAFATKLENK